MVLKIWRRRM